MKKKIWNLMQIYSELSVSAVCVFAHIVNSLGNRRNGSLGIGWPVCEVHIGLAHDHS